MPMYSVSHDAVSAFSILRIKQDGPAPASDLVAIEEPLEIRLAYTRNGVEVHKAVAVTMRTPGHDRELAAGFLFTEGIIRDPADVAGIQPAAEAASSITVTLRSDVAVDIRRLSRSSYTTSSCGVCGKASLDAVRTLSRHPLPSPEPSLDAGVIHRLSASMRAAQPAFDQTGGLHAAALFTFEGKLLALHEDIGRHNALDKLIGSQLLARSSALPLSQHIVFVSSRASFELMQKLIMAGCPVLAAAGAPSSLAIELARESGATLLGFVRENRFNVYAGATRIRALAGACHP